VAGILKHLRLATEKPHNSTMADNEFCCIDPCAGEGAAINQLAVGLGIPNVHAIELDIVRSAKCKELMPTAKILGPCALQSVHISPSHVGSGWGLAYVNPPFDDELGGGGREELRFVERIAPSIATGGILVLVTPFHQVIGSRDMCVLLDSKFDKIEVYRFPDGHDLFKEAVTFARKRREPLPKNDAMRLGNMHTRGWNWMTQMPYLSLPVLGSCQPLSWNYTRPQGFRSGLDIWEIPFSRSPRTFDKQDYTPEELEQALLKSPLNNVFDIPPDLGVPRPPLALGKGHVSLLIVSGVLDGLVPSDPPHVVRGSAKKVERCTAVQSEENLDTGAVKTKTTYEEEMVPVIRAVEQEGTIHTFSRVVSDNDEEALEDCE
jgi:hypothetical protein